MKIIEAIKAIYPDLNGGVIYWNTKQDGSDWDNPEDGLIWNNTEYTKPSWADIEAKLSIVNLDNLKNIKKAELETIRDVNFAQFISHTKGNFPASKTAISLLGSLVSGWNGASTEKWRDINNNMVSLTKTECKEVLRAIKDSHTPIYEKEATVANQIDAITDATELENFNVKANWDAL